MLGQSEKEKRICFQKVKQKTKKGKKNEKEKLKRKKEEEEENNFRNTICVEVVYFLKKVPLEQKENRRIKINNNETK